MDKKDFESIIKKNTEVFGSDKWVDLYIRWFNENPEDVTKDYKYAPRTMQTFVNYKEGGYIIPKTKGDRKSYTDEKWAKILRDTKGIMILFRDYILSERINDLGDTYWSVYFFYNDLDFSRQVYFGVAKMSFSRPSFGKEKRARLQNVKDGVSLDKEGIYKYSKNSAVISIDLEAQERGGQTLHMKLNQIEDISDEIMLGAYVSHEKQTVTAGTVVFKRLENKDAYDNKQIGVCSLTKNIALFNDIDSGIKYFLSVKNENHLKIPNNIFSKKSLKAKTTSYRRKRRHHSKFIAPEKFTIYVSVPSTNLKTEDFKKTQSEIEVLKIYMEKVFYECLDRKKNISRELNIKKDPEVKFINRGDSQDIKEETASNSLILSDLKRTDLYIFFFKEIISLSHVELGVAMALSKQILVIYEERMSIKIRRFLNADGVTVEYCTDIEDKKFVCRTQIEKFFY